MSGSQGATRGEKCSCNLFDGYGKGHLLQINTFSLVVLFVRAKLRPVVLSLLTGKCFEIYADNFVDLLEKITQE